MSEIKIVNAKGLACPQPVVLTKQALESHEKVMVIVDNDNALENVKRLGVKSGCDACAVRAFCDCHFRRQDGTGQ